MGEDVEGGNGGGGGGGLGHAAHTVALVLCLPSGVAMRRAIEPYSR